MTESIYNQTRQAPEAPHDPRTELVNTLPAMDQAKNLLDNAVKKLAERGINNPADYLDNIVNQAREQTLQDALKTLDITNSWLGKKGVPPEALKAFKLTYEKTMRTVNQIDDVAMTLLEKATAASGLPMPNVICKASQVLRTPGAPQLLLKDLSNTVRHPAAPLQTVNSPMTNNAAK